MSESKNVFFEWQRQLCIEMLENVLAFLRLTKGSQSGEFLNCAMALEKVMSLAPLAEENLKKLESKLLKFEKIAKISEVVKVSRDKGLAIVIIFMSFYLCMGELSENEKNQLMWKVKKVFFAFNEKHMNHMNASFFSFQETNEKDIMVHQDFFKFKKNVYVSWDAFSAFFSSDEDFAMRAGLFAHMRSVLEKKPKKFMDVTVSTPECGCDVCHANNWRNEMILLTTFDMFSPLTFEERDFIASHFSRCSTVCEYAKPSKRCQLNNLLSEAVRLSQH